MLDLWQNNAAVDAGFDPAREGNAMPQGIGDSFDAAWHEGQLFGSSIASFNARNAALDDYAAEVKRKTGTALDLNPEGGADMWAQANDQVRALKAKNPALGIDPLEDDEIDRRAAAISGDAHRAYTANREQAFGGRIGSFFGSAASGLADPVNLVGLAVAPEAELGVLSTAGVWAAIGAGTQGINEAVQAPFRARVEPGYAESGQAAGNILSAGIGGAVLGSGFKAAGAAWSRLKTGDWPRTVRDAGNIVESEAQIHDSNILPGAEGVAAHTEAMGKAIDDIVAGRAVEAPESVTPELFGTPEAKIDAMMADRGTASELTAAAKAERATSDELPFDATTKEALAEQHAGTLSGRLEGLGVPAADAADLADRVIAAKSDDEARAILNEAMARPQTIAGTVPSVAAIVKQERLASWADEIADRETAARLTPEARATSLADPKTNTAMMTEIERLRDTGEGGMIPMGVDEKGEPQFKLLDAAIQDAKNDVDAADQIESCMSPPAEEAAE